MAPPDQENDGRRAPKGSIMASAACPPRRPELEREVAMRSARLSAGLSTLLHRVLGCVTPAALLVGCGSLPDATSACAPGDDLCESAAPEPPATEPPIDMPPCAAGETLIEGGSCQEAGI